VFDSENDASFYVNGDFQLKVAGTSPATVSSQVFNVGRNPDPNSVGNYQYLTGRLDEVAIYGRALQPEEIQEHYLAGVPEPSTLLLLCIGAVAFGVHCLRRRRCRAARNL
jgi:hypothetical protein